MRIIKLKKNMNLPGKYNIAPKRLMIMLLVFYLAAINTQAQNLVPNDGFDINNACPNQIGQINKADGWSVWGGTADYFHSCANPTHPIFGTPNNNRGYRTPRSGEAYVGIFTYSALANNGREFIGRALAAPMIPGTTYYVSMYVCKADVAAISHSTNNIGVRFSTVPYSLVNPDTALNNAHVWSTAVLNDTMNWVEVSGSFVADSAYNYIGIGNYFSDSATIIVPGDATSNYAYYLIDDICVSDVVETCQLITDRKENTNEFIGNVFPNPGRGNFNIQLSNRLNGNIQVYDFTGKLICNKFVNANPGDVINIDLPYSATGLLTLVANGKAKRIQVVK